MLLVRRRHHPWSLCILIKVLVDIPSLQGDLGDSILSRRLLLESCGCSETASDASVGSEVTPQPFWWLAVVNLLGAQEERIHANSLQTNRIRMLASAAGFGPSNEPTTRI